MVKVLDFGLAKATREGPAGKSLTHTGQMLGTPDYIAPEQSLDATKADIRADIYSLGCTLYYLLTGGPPFQGTSLYEVLQAHHSMEAKPLNLVRPDVPWELAAVVGRMMAKDPDRRYQTPGEVARALWPFYKPAESEAAAGKAELSQAGQAPAVERVARPVAIPAPDASPSPPLTQPEELARPVSIWQSLVRLDWPKRTSVRRGGAAPSRIWPPPPWIWPLVAGAVLVGLVIWWAPGVLKVKTRDGVIVVENVPEDAVVEVDGDKVTITPVKGEPVRIEAPPGEHQVIVKRGNDRLMGERVTVESGKSYSLSVRKIPLKDALLVLENVPANAAVELDGEKVQVAAMAGQPLKIAAEPGRHVVVVKQGDEVLLAEGVTLESGRPVKRTIAQKEPAVTHAPPPPPSGPPPIAVTPKAGGLAEPSKPSAGPKPGGGDVSRSPAPPAPEYVTHVGQIKLRVIPAGSFQMGSPAGKGDGDEHPQHAVRIARPFYLGVYEVTQAQYEEIMGTNPSWFSATGGGKDKVAGQSTDRHPVESVSWLDAVKFCNRLSEKERLEPFYKIAGGSVRVASWDGAGFRLPTEAEWEYACRAGPEGQGRYTFGDADEELGDHAWFGGNSGKVTHPVGQKRRNRFGLFDMHGNVWEWCQDWYDENYYTQSPTDDPRGPDAAADRVFRGGGWVNGPVFCRSAGRSRPGPAIRNGRRGFRLALTHSGR